MTCAKKDIDNKITLASHGHYNYFGAYSKFNPFLNMLLFYVISKKGDINIGLRLNKDGQKKICSY